MLPGTTPTQLTLQYEDAMQISVPFVDGLQQGLMTIKV